MSHDDPDETGSARPRCRTVANAVFLPCVFIAPLDFPAVYTRTYIHAYGLPTITTSSKQRRSSAPSCTREFLLLFPLSPVVYAPRAPETYECLQTHAYKYKALELRVYNVPAYFRLGLFVQIRVE